MAGSYGNIANFIVSSLHRNIHPGNNLRNERLMKWLIKILSVVGVC